MNQHHGLQDRAAATDCQNKVNPIPAGFWETTWGGCRCFRVPSKKFLFNFHRDLVQPFLGAVGAVLMVSRLDLQFAYTLLGGAQLSG